MREGSYFLDYSRGMTPGCAQRTKEKFKRLIQDSYDRIDALKKHRETILNTIDDKIEKEQTYIQEAELVIRTIDESFDREYETLMADSDKTDEQEVKDIDEHHELILYGSPCPLY